MNTCKRQPGLSLKVAITDGYAFHFLPFPDKPCQLIMDYCNQVDHMCPIYFSSSTQPKNASTQIQEEKTKPFRVSYLDPFQPLCSCHYLINLEDLNQLDP